jgi:hypothetical protein
MGCQLGAGALVDYEAEARAIRTTTKPSWTSINMDAPAPDQRELLRR